MIGIIAAVMILVSVLYGVFNGSINNVASMLLSGSTEAVEFCLKIGGTICFFCGIMKVAEEAGINAKLAGILNPLLSKIVPLSTKSEKTRQAVSMNISSNILGLGNAATPFGIKATAEMFRLGGLKAPNRSIASFIILNTSSVQLIPSTVAAIRQANGAEAPFEIVLPVIVSQFGACIFGLILVSLLFKD